MVNYVEDNITEEITLEAMSEKVGYSAFYCSSKFHEHVGISFKDYITRRRLTLAAQDLKNTSLNILDIAVKYGFSSHEAFTRAFSKIYGCTPYRFRKTSPAVVYYEKPIL
jgi:AraC-type DNA-binding domain-containing proteins